ncbi:MAG: 2-hydroxychromene-2-carboxylate isomerase [Pseudomonadales bacterium]|nr:2-hydroxychromene-2-carboxylate isomerase [Pseudomonadales bacterium]
MHTIDFYFDCSSPWTYLAFEAFQPLAARTDVTVTWKPILVGGIFNSVNPSVYESRQKPVPAKARYAAKDLRDWARHVGIEIGSPPVFPVNSVKVMRGAFFAIEQGRLVPYARRAFQRYWGELADISRDEEVRGIAAAAGLDPDVLLARIAMPEYKAQLRATTDELIARGGFGSPTLFVNGDDMYFGNDRLPLVAAALTR